MSYVNGKKYFKTRLTIPDFYTMAVVNITNVEFEKRSNQMTVADDNLQM